MSNTHIYFIGFYTNIKGEDNYEKTIINSRSNINFLS